MPSGWTVRDAGIGSWPDRQRRVRPDAPAIRFEGRTTTHGEFAARVRAAAAALAGLGIGKGDRVGCVSANHPAMLESLLGCARLGAIWVPVNGRLSVPEMTFVLADAGAVVVLHGREHGTTADQLASALPEVRRFVAFEPPSAGGADSLHWEELLAGATAEVGEVDVELTDPCLVMYTSGTTGTPKGAVLTHGNMTWNSLNQLLGFDLGSDERTLALGPMFHIGGLNGTVMPTLLRGGCVVVVRGFDAAGTLDVIEQERVTSFFAVPTMLDEMSRQPDFADRDLSALRAVMGAGAPLPLPTLTTWSDRGVHMQQAYGMTETSPGATVLDAADARRKLGSAGKPVFFTDVRVVRADGSPAAPGEVGEVVVQGPNVMAGYWGRPDETAEAIRDGWFHSGDAGSFDEEGFLTIRDRFKDMIISGGENVYPAEVESALLELPGVQEAAVLGVPDDTWGEVGLAVVVAAPGADLDAATLSTALRERLAGFKVPKQYRFTDTLPKTASGKIRKPDLRQLYTLDEETP